MLSALAQRSGFKLSGLAGSLLLRSRAAPIVLHPVATRTFGSTLLLSFPKTATQETTKKTKLATSSTKKSTTKTPAAKARTAAKKPAAKRAQKPEAKNRITKDGIRIRDGRVVIGKEYARPKAATPAFMLFYSDYWKAQDRAGVTLADAPHITAEARAAWAKLSVEEQQPYRDAAAAEQAAAKQRIAEWKASLPLKIRTEINRRRVAAGKNKWKFRRPTDPSKPFILPPFTRWIRDVFTAQFRETNPKPAGVALFTAAGPAWRALPEHEKQPFIDAFQREKDAAKQAR